MPRLKVFAATSGIHDHIVAAPSRPAALRAWGAKTDLFSMGVARQVTDPGIVKQALARPGEVLRVGRSGSIEETEPARKKAAPRKQKPPSRARLAAAERQLEALQSKQAVEAERIEQELAALARKREQLDKRHAKTLGAAEKKVEGARDAYQAALDAWSE